MAWYDGIASWLTGGGESEKKENTSQQAGATSGNNNLPSGPIGPVTRESGLQNFIDNGFSQNVEEDDDDKQSLFDTAISSAKNVSSPSNRYTQKVREFGNNAGSYISKKASSIADQVIESVENSDLVSAALKASGDLAALSNPVSAPIAFNAAVGNMVLDELNKNTSEETKQSQISNDIQSLVDARDNFASKSPAEHISNARDRTHRQFKYLGNIADNLGTDGKRNKEFTKNVFGAGYEYDNSGINRLIPGQSISAATYGIDVPSGAVDSAVDVLGHGEFRSKDKPLELFELTLGVMEAQGLDLTNAALVTKAYKETLRDVGGYPEGMINSVTTSSLIKGINKDTEIQEEIQLKNDSYEEWLDENLTEEQKEKRSKEEEEAKEYEIDIFNISDIEGKQSQFMDIIIDTYGDALHANETIGLSADATNTLIGAYRPGAVEIANAKQTAKRARESGQEDLALDIEREIDKMEQFHAKYRSVVFKLIETAIREKLPSESRSDYFDDKEYDFEEWVWKEMGYDEDDLDKGILGGIVSLDRSPDDVLRDMGVDVARMRNEQSNSIGYAQAIYGKISSIPVLQDVGLAGENLAGIFQDQRGDMDMAELDAFDAIPGFQSRELGIKAQNGISQYSDEVGRLLPTEAATTALTLGANGLKVGARGIRGVNQLARSKRITQFLNAANKLQGVARKADTALSAVGLGNKLSTTNQAQRVISNAFRIAKITAKELQIENGVYNLDTERSSDFAQQLGAITFVVPLVFMGGSSLIKRSINPFGMDELLDAGTTADTKWVTRQQANMIKDQARIRYKEYRDKILKDPIIGKSLKKSAALSEMTKKHVLKVMDIHSGANRFADLTDDEILQAVRETTQNADKAQMRAMSSLMLDMIDDDTYNVADVVSVLRGKRQSVGGIKPTLSKADIESTNALTGKVAETARKTDMVGYYFSNGAEQAMGAVFGFKFHPGQTISEKAFREAKKNSEKLGLFDYVFNSEDSVGKYFRNVGTEKKPKYKLTEDGKSAMGIVPVISKDYIARAVSNGEDITEMIEPYLSKNPDLLEKIRTSQIGEETRILIHNALCK